MQIGLRALAVGAVIANASCSRSSSDEPIFIDPGARTQPAPAKSDVGECADVAEERACWASALEVVRVDRNLTFSKNDRGYRCAGSGPARVCEDRALASDAFQCAGDGCTQRHPRMPDTGEWECADLDGVVVCRGWSAAAGVVAGPDDLGWFCGPRRGAANQRICVDFAPDRPSGEPWSCRFQYEIEKPLRLCLKGGRPPLGRACDALRDPRRGESGCPLGSVCASGHCLPLKPDPGCWIDRDCGSAQKCAFGSCRTVKP